MKVCTLEQSTASNEMQFAPDFDVAAKGASFVVITCSHTDALAACKQRIAALAVPSAYCPDGDEETGGIKASSQPTPALHSALVEWTRMMQGAVIVCSPEMKKNNTTFKRIEAFRDALSNEASAPVAIAIISESKAQLSVASNEKYLLGAWIDSPGVRIESIMSWLVLQMTTEREKYAVKPAGGYIPLGYSETGQEVWVWSCRCEAARQLRMQDVSNGGHLIMTCGKDWIDSRYGYTEPRTGNRKLAFDRLGIDIVEACSIAGNFRRDKLRGTGVWCDPVERNVLIINSAEKVWRTDGKIQSRVEKGGHIYQASSTLGVTEGTAEATTAEIEEFRVALATWRFTRGDTDVKLVLGWVMLAFVCGALKWRPHISITGGLQAGKSTLVELIGVILGHAALVRDGGSSESGVRQELGARSCAVLLDEAESDADRLNNLITFFRSGSSGTKKVMGTPSHAAQIFEMRAMGLVAGIIPPKMAPADESRFIQLQLDGNNPEAISQPSRLIRDPFAARNLGVKVFARMLRQWPRFCNCNNAVREAMRAAGREPRFVDTFAATIAASWVGQYDQPMTSEEAVRYVASFDLGDDGSRLNEANDETLIWHHLLLSQIQIGNHSISIASAAEFAFAEPLQGTHRVALGEKGLRINDDSRDEKQRRMYVHTRNPEIAKLFRDTPWKSANLDVPLRRLPGTIKCQTAVRVGSFTCKPLSVVLPG